MCVCVFNSWVILAKLAPKSQTEELKTEARGQKPWNSDVVDGIPDAFECGLALYKHKFTGSFSTSILVSRVWYVSTKRKQRLWEAGAATTSLNQSDGD